MSVKTLLFIKDVISYTSFNVLLTIGALFPFAPDKMKNGFYYKYFVERWWYMYSLAVNEYNRETELGASAPNPSVYLLNKPDKLLKLLDFSQPNRPLVLNFGSCTWPPFMDHMAKFNQLVESYSDVIDFVLIYIAEAHPSDDWAIPGNLEVAAHKELGDRMAAAKLLVELKPPPCPVLVDDITNQAGSQYSAKPERLFIVRNGKIVYHGGIGPFEYKMEEVADWLKKWKAATL